MATTEIFFNRIDPVSGTELWVTDGTTAGTHLVKDINPGAASSSPTEAISGFGQLFF